jgi:hypothetical protein
VEKFLPTLITECKASKEVEFDTNQRLSRLRLICIAKQPHIFFHRRQAATALKSTAFFDAPQQFGLNTRPLLATKLAELFSVSRETSIVLSFGLAAPKRGYGVVIRMRVGRQIPEGNRVIGGTFNLAAGKHSGRVTVS